MARLRHRGDSGVTLVEMLVVMVIMAIVSTMSVVIVQAINRTVRQEDDETRGLGDVRRAVERLDRDVRDARGITISADPAVSATASQLTVWIDFNSDYVHQTTEDVTWNLVSAGGGHYNMVRTVAGSTPIVIVEARTLVSNLAFNYCKADGTCVTQPTSTTGIELIKTDMTYDPVIGSGSGQRHVVVQSRMRNVA